MPRTEGAKGKRQLGAVRVRDANTLVPINADRVRALLMGRTLFSLARRGLDRRQLQRLRDGFQRSVRFGRLGALAGVLGVPVAELLATSGPGETAAEYRLDVSARTLAGECWRAGGREGPPPLWLANVLRGLLDYDLWAGAIQEGGTAVLSIDPPKGGRLKKRALARLEERRQRFGDAMAEAVRLLLPTPAERSEGLRVSPRRAGAVVGAFRDKVLPRMTGISHPGTAQTRAIAARVAQEVAASGVVKGTNRD